MTLPAPGSGPPPPPVHARWDFAVLRLKSWDPPPIGTAARDTGGAGHEASRWKARRTADSQHRLQVWGSLGPQSDNAGGQGGGAGQGEVRGGGGPTVLPRCLRVALREPAMFLQVEVPRKQQATLCPTGAAPPPPRHKAFPTSLAQSVCTLAHAYQRPTAPEKRDLGALSLSGPRMHRHLPFSEPESGKRTAVLNISPVFQNHL